MMEAQLCIFFRGPNIGELEHEPKLFKLTMLYELEVERAWAQAPRPGPDFGLAVNKLLARGSTSLIFQ